MVTGIKNKTKADKAKIPDKKISNNGGAKMKITGDEYIKLADLCYNAAKKHKKLSAENAYYEVLARKCLAKSDQLLKPKATGGGGESKGSSTQKKKGERWKCTACKHKFSKPVDRKHCPTCDSTDIEQLKLTAFTSSSKKDVDLEPGESPADQEIELPAV